MTDAREILIENGYLPLCGPEQEEQFGRACKDGLLDVVRAWLDLGMSPNARQSISHETALIKAAEGGHIPVLDLLLQRGADPELRDSSDDTAFRTALNWSHPEAARFLASKKVDLDAASKYGESSLEHAIDEDKEDDVKLLLELGANPNFHKDGRSPMRSAIDKGDARYVRMLLDGGASTSTTLDDHRATALHLAVRANNEDAKELLLERGASIDARDKYGLTPVDYALMSGSELGSPTPQQRARAKVWSLVNAEDFEGALEAMEREDVNVETRNQNHETFLAAFARAGHVDGVRRLLKRGAKPDVQATTAALAKHQAVTFEILRDAKAPLFDERGESPGIESVVWDGPVDLARAALDACTDAERARLVNLARSAVMQKNTEMLKLLIEKKIPLEHRSDIGGDTALSYAVTAYHVHENVKLLLDAGVDINQGDKNETPLHKIVAHYGWDESYEPTLRLLVQRGARFDIVDWLGRTPWDAARDEVKDVFAKIICEQKRHDWATLEAFLHLGQIDRMFQVIDGGVAIDPPAGTPRVETVIFEAISTENERAVLGLIQRGANVNVVSHYNSTPLSYAACKPNLTILRALLDAGAKPTADALSSAVTHVENVKLLALRGAPVDDRVDSALLMAARNGHLESVQFLLSRGAPPDVRGPYGDTPLTAAIEKGFTDVVHALVEKGASPKFPSRESGETPMTAAAKKGDVDLVKLLLSKGGSLEDTNRAGESVVSIILARKPLRTAFGDTLASMGIDTTVPKFEPLDAKLTNPGELWWSVYHVEEEAILEAIDEKKLSVDARDPWGVTPLMAAVFHRSYSLIEALLERGANVLLEDEQKAQAYDYVGFARDEEIDRMLQARAKESLVSMDRLNAQAARSLVATDVTKALERGEIKKLASLLREKKLHPYLSLDGNPILISLVQRTDEDFVGAILDLGFSPDTRSRWGESALLVALREGKMEIAERLVRAGAKVDEEQLDDDQREWLKSQRGI